VVLNEAQRIQFVGMANVDAVVKLVEKPERSPVKVGDDLHDHAPDSGGVNGFEGIRIPA